MNMWDIIRQELSQRVSEESFHNWFEHTRFQGEEAGRIYVAVPSLEAQDYIRQTYSELITAIIRDRQLPVRDICFEVAPPAGTQREELSPEPAPSAKAPELNPEFTFQTFVVGSSNQFAHAAAKAVSEQPASKYNPLLIYGGVGLGKTHLLHAIAHALIDRRTDLRVIYTTGERFMNEMIRSIRYQRMPQFHQTYRCADVLLVDDVHILAGKEATQEEFFHTFNELYEHRKQIVISSDSPPKEIPGLVERLKSRFEWGLVADIQPPDLETKLAILDRKAEQEGVNVPEEVRIFIATHTRSNVRELRGALTRLIAYSSVTGAPITLQLAHQALRNLLPAYDRRISIEAIMRAVAMRFNLQVSDLKQRSNMHRITWPRQIAMYLSKELTPASLPEIGRAFGGKHHTTVLHAIQKIEHLRQKDPDLNRLLHSLSDSLHG